MPDNQALEEAGVYRIPRVNIAYLRKRIEKLNRKAARLGTQPISLEVIACERIKEMVKDDLAPNIPPFKYKWTGRYLYYDFVKVAGESPKLEDWELLATLEIRDKGTIIRTVPGQQAPKEYRDAKPKCDHCATSRYRKEHFLVRHSNGKVSQVGRNCLRDFLGNVDPKRIARLATWIREIEDALRDSFNYRGEGEPYFMDLTHYLSFVSAIIIKFGWLSRKQSDINAQAGKGPTQTTSSRAFGNADPKQREELRRHNPRELVDPTEETRKEAEAAIAWVKSWKHELNDFEHNVSMVVAEGALRGGDQGIAAAIISSYRRAKGLVKKREERKKQDSGSKHFGTVGKREVFRLKLDFQRDFASDWGVSILYKLRDEAGNVATYWASRDLRLVEGETYTIKATVKDHELYDGIKQTKISRGALLCEPHKKPVKHDLGAIWKDGELQGGGKTVYFCDVCRDEENEKIEAYKKARG